MLRKNEIFKKASQEKMITCGRMGIIFFSFKLKPVKTYYNLLTRILKFWHFLVQITINLESYLSLAERMCKLNLLIQHSMAALCQLIIYPEVFWNFTLAVASGFGFSSALTNSVQPFKYLLTIQLLKVCWHTPSWGRKKF